MDGAGIIFDADDIGSSDIVADIIFYTIDI